ncbi:unnamed protein product, partial [Symbiodinium pilosum]
ADYQRGFESGYAAGKQEVMKMRQPGANTWSNYAFQLITDVVILIIVLIGFGRLERCFYRTAKAPEAPPAAEEGTSQPRPKFTPHALTRSYEATIQHHAQG